MKSESTPPALGARLRRAWRALVAAADRDEADRRQRDIDDPERRPRRLRRYLFAFAVLPIVILCYVPAANSGLNLLSEKYSAADSVAARAIVCALSLVVFAGLGRAFLRELIVATPPVAAKSPWFVRSFAAWLGSMFLLGLLQLVVVLLSHLFARTMPPSVDVAMMAIPFAMTTQGFVVWLGKKGKVHATHAALTSIILLCGAVCMMASQLDWEILKNPSGWQRGAALALTLPWLTIPLDALIARLKTRKP